MYNSMIWQQKQTDRHTILVIQHLAQYTVVIKQWGDLPLLVTSYQYMPHYFVKT